MDGYSGKICPFCGTEILEGDAVKVCPYCGAEHHAECWELNGGCATLTSRIFGAGDTLALDAFAGGAEFCPMGEFVIADARENGV